MALVQAAGTDQCHCLQMLGLYKLHLENTELPPNYAQLLQLRDMLELDAAEAEQLEADVMSNAAQFSI